MRAVYVMCDGTSRKIGISSRPKDRRAALENMSDSSVTLKKEFWIENDDAAAIVEITAHSMAGNPSFGREWFDISTEDAIVAVRRAMDYLCVSEVPAPVLPKISDAQSRALIRQREKMDKAGERLMSVRLSEKTIAKIELMAKSYGSRQKVIEALVLAD